MPVFKMRKLCLRQSEHTRTKKQRRFIWNFFNIRLTKNTCALMKPTLFSVKIYTSHSYFRVYKVIVLCTGFDLKKINTIIAYINLFWFLNQNHKMKFEKWSCWQNNFLYMTVTHIWMQNKLRRHKIASRILCTFTELNQLIFR